MLERFFFGDCGHSQRLRLEVVIGSGQEIDRAFDTAATGSRWQLVHKERGLPNQKGQKERKWHDTSGHFPVKSVSASCHSLHRTSNAAQHDVLICI